jgi:outer membrane protein assembly factor BamE (lipoprotein component of BamABCDE complex)
MAPSSLAKSFLLASALAGVAPCVISAPAEAAQGAPGITITSGEAAGVRTGMSEAEVLQVLGPPAEVFRYTSYPGPSWNYRVAGAYGSIEFNVDFASDGRVIAAGYRSISTG